MSSLLSLVHHSRGRGFLLARTIAPAVLVSVVGVCDALAQACAPSDCLPPVNAVYSGQTHQIFSFLGQQLDVGNPVHRGFSSCDAPPASTPGASATYTLNLTVEADVSLNGAPPSHYEAPAVLTVRYAFKSQNGAVRTFDTEMLQLDISGGQLPPGVMIRESPTLASTGQTTIQPESGGGFRFDSFFDEFWELSPDGGTNWIPSSNGPERMTLIRPECLVPTEAETWSRLRAIYR